MKKFFKLGQSLFEVIMALGLVTLIIVAVVAMAEISIKNSSYSKSKTMATRHAESAMEWLRGQRDESWDNFSDMALNYQTICLKNLNVDDIKLGGCSDEPDEDVIFDTNLKREVVFDTLDLLNGNIGVSVNVFWTDAGGYHEAVTSTVFTDWRFQNEED